MRVLHLAPLWFPVAADALGGRETFLAGLIAALERVGVESALVASGDSRTTAELVPASPENLYAMMGAGKAWEYAYYEQHQLLLALERARDFDLVHSHVGPAAYVLSGVPGLCVLHTQHTPALEDLLWFAAERPDVWFSTVSEFQARKLRERGARRCEVIHNAIDVGAIPCDARGGPGLAFVGRIEPLKGPDLAVEVARRLGLPLVLAGPVIDQAFFASSIEPHLSERIRYAGVVGARERDEIFGGAGCAILPFRGEEGFGMVTIEAMACGTPVVALANGALPEIVDPGVTGYLTDDRDELAALVGRALALDRAAVRRRVAERFDLSIAAARYRALYERMLGES